MSHRLWPHLADASGFHLSALAACSILLTLPVFPAASVAEGAERPNILFIMSDDKYD
jgi:hypothetical protein